LLCQKEKQETWVASSFCLSSFTKIPSLSLRLSHVYPCRDDHFRFGLVFIKTNNQIEFFLKKPNRNRFKPTSFGLFFRTKTGSNRFGSVFPVWLGFGSVFFWFFLVWVRFCFFSLGLIKSKLNWTGWFFKNSNRFFFTVRFFRFFFPVFSV